MCSMNCGWSVSSFKSFLAQNEVSQLAQSLVQKLT